MPVSPFKKPPRSFPPFTREDALEFCALGKAGDVDGLKKMFDEFGPAILNERDNGGDTAMTWAAWLGHVQTVKFLLDKGAGLESPGMQGKTALIWAAQGSRTEIVQMLLERGANVDARDDNGNTALKICENNSQTVPAKQIRDWIARQEEMARLKKQEEETRALTAERLNELKKKAPKIRLGPKPPGA
jgi:hypothetical protein